jgi:class 3 adenylate cyclase
VPNAYLLPDQRLVECRPAEAVLTAALRAGVPFAHACGGHAACSTCRVVVVQGRNECLEPTVRERMIADRLGFPAEFRLACQTRITGDVTMRRLVLDSRDIEHADIRRRNRRDGRRRKRFWSRGAPGPRGGRPQPIGVEVAAAVLFADIRGFTPFSAALLPYDVIHVLQRHVDQVTRAVERNGGVVTSYMGDGVMALFLPEGRRQRPSVRALRAGAEMLADVEAGRAAIEELYGRSFELNVGVHTGPVIVGTLWGDRATLTAMGDNVNVASRVEQANKECGTRFLVSEETLADAEDAVRIGRSFRCCLPGTAGERTLIEVVGVTEQPGAASLASP